MDTLELLKMLRALDNEVRLRILLILMEEKEGISFNELARKLNIERGLLAYHIGILKHLDLVKCVYERRSRSVSRYSITERGKKVLLYLIKSLEESENQEESEQVEAKASLL